MSKVTNQFMFSSVFPVTRMQWELVADNWEENVARLGVGLW